MPVRTRLATFALVMTFLGAVLSHASAFAQDSNQDEIKRQVISKVSPRYPPLARQLRLSGKVKLELVVAPDGHVKATRTIGGSPLLVNATLDAVRMWKYEPGPKETIEVVEIDFKNPDQ